MRRREQGSGDPGEEARLPARPVQTSGAGHTNVPLTGLRSLGLGQKRDGLIYVPSGYRAEDPAPFLLSLHGAGGNAQYGIGLLQHLADAANVIILAPESREGTWDIILGEYGPDIIFINRALEQVFQQYTIDSSRCAIGGFSDGASYALSLGITKGDLFSHILALSPGFMAPAAQRGVPRVFISHGTGDNVLPIDLCSRRIVPQLQSAGYDLHYIEFEGGHVIPPQVAQQAVEWFIGSSAM